MRGRFLRIRQGQPRHANDQREAPSAQTATPSQAPRGNRGGRLSGIDESFHHQASERSPAYRGLHGRFRRPHKQTPGGDISYFGLNCCRVTGDGLACFRFQTDQSKSLPTD